MTTLEILTAARAKIEKGWCERTSARDKYGKPVEATSPEAVRWCALGAIDASKETLEDYEDARKFMESVVGDIIDANDNALNKAGVVALFDKAIERARKEQG